MKTLWKRLTRERGASTLIRVATSRHVADLQLIFWASCFLTLFGSAFVFYWHRMVEDSGIIGAPALITAIVGTGFGVLAWTYQAGSARLGVVDLFTCEITTICRVVAVSEMASHLTQMYTTPPPAPVKFDSQEQYSPVFNSNSKDLESLEARVVAPVTEFYTYLKAMRDYLRALSAIERPRDTEDAWRISVRNVAYMLFLMLESGRETVKQLLEFEPEEAENTIMILLSELVAFKLLLGCFEIQGRNQSDSNARLERLQLRRQKYPSIVHEAYCKAKFHPKVDKADQERWARAEALLGELDQCFYLIYGERIDPRRCAADRRHTS